MRFWVQLPSRCLAFGLILAVRLYQVILSPLLGGSCKFYPSCSQYFILAVEKYGPVRGSLKGIGRLCRCHPFAKPRDDFP